MKKQGNSATVKSHTRIKMKKKISLTIIAIIMLLVVAISSYATVEIVPSKNGKGNDSIVNTSISNSYLLCQGMKKCR